MGEGNIQVILSVSVHDNLSWDVYVEGQKLPAGVQALSSLQQPLFSSSHLLEIIQTLDTCVRCCGNPDKKFEALRLTRRGVFMDVTGKFSTE